MTIFNMTHLKATLGKSTIQLQPSQDEFLDCNNNPIHILGKVAVKMALNGWAAPAQVSVISRNHQSIHGLDLMGTLGLELVQRKKLIGITGEGSSQEEEESDELQTYFCKLCPNLFTRIGQIRKAKVRAELFENLKPILPKDMSSVVLNRLHHNHHGRDKIFAAAKDFWIPLMHRNLAATAKNCKSCLEAGKHLKPDVPKMIWGTHMYPGNLMLWFNYFSGVL